MLVMFYGGHARLRSFSESPEIYRVSITKLESVETYNLLMQHTSVAYFKPYWLMKSEPGDSVTRENPTYEDFARYGSLYVFDLNLVMLLKLIKKSIYYEKILTRNLT